VFKQPDPIFILVLPMAQSLMATIPLEKIFVITVQLQKLQNFYGTKIWSHTVFGCFIK